MKNTMLFFVVITRLLILSVLFHFECVFGKKTLEELVTGHSSSTQKQPSEEEEDKKKETPTCQQSEFVCPDKISIDTAMNVLQLKHGLSDTSIALMTIDIMKGLATTPITPASFVLLMDYTKEEWLKNGKITTTVCLDDICTETPLDDPAVVFEDVTEELARNLYSETFLDETKKVIEKRNKVFSRSYRKEEKRKESQRDTR
jgi:hypothetical protein